MQNPKFKVMSDAYGRLGLYKRISESVPGAMSDWEQVCEQEDFADVLAAIPKKLEE